MYKLKPWQSGTTLLLAFSINASTFTPIVKQYPAYAQRTLPAEITGRIAAGTLIPVKYQTAQRIIVASDEPGPIPLTLIVARNIVTTQPTLLIPSGTQIVGELVTMQEIGSAQFVAKQLVLSDGKRIPISASSRLITKTQEISDSPTLGRTIGNAALGTGAAAALAAVSGNPAIASGQVVLSSGFGSSSELLGRFRNQETVRLLSIEPDKDLTLTLNSDLILRRSAS